MFHPCNYPLLQSYSPQPLLPPHEPLSWSYKLSHTVSYRSFVAQHHNPSLHFRHSLIEWDLLIINEAVLLKVLFTLFYLL